MKYIAQLINLLSRPLAPLSRGVKPLCVLTALLACALAGVAQKGVRPVLVGHRGSLWGLENSVESFTNGALKGYDFLETDFKLTADGQFVCSHDDDTKRLGGTLELAKATLAQLQAEPLTQTRSGVKYTGRLCSAQEYLDVCRTYGVRPLIELKWTAGVNSNDCSNIPLLIDLIERNGFRQSCIILTSMKPCLEYIRKNYPDIALQFLTGQYWESNFPWCVEHGIGADIQKGYFDKATIDRFHEAGLDVNIWTTNSDDEYKKFGDWGVDFITTDSLDPATLPEIDPMSAVRPNKADYPDNALSPRGWFTPAATARWQLDAAPQAAAFGPGVLHTLDARGLNTLDLATGTQTLRPMAATALACGSDGTVYTLSPCPGGTSLTLAALPPGQAAPCWAVSLPIAGSDAKIAVSGALQALKIFIAVPQQQPSQPLVLHVLDANTQGASYVGALTMPQALNPIHLGWWNVCNTPTSRDNVILESSLQPARCLRVERTGTLRLWEFATGSEQTRGVGRSFGRLGPATFMLLGPQDQGATLHNVTQGTHMPTAVSNPLCPGQTPMATALDPRADALYVLLPDGAVLCHTLTGHPAPQQPQSVDIALERLWIHSLATGNAPTQGIDGATSQQCAVAAGCILVHNTAGQTIDFYNASGLCGTLPGGCGYGIATDQAGNIIVRDDVETTARRRFLIYPAGTAPTPANAPAASSAAQPVVLEVNTALDGQANFHAASGNVLGPEGYIYLYPKGHAQVEALRLAQGTLQAHHLSGTLKLTGSVAGNVQPLNNNAEEFLYQIRNYGIYRYCGGQNEAVSTDRASTTQPQRNGTGGMALFTIGGNTLLAHNSGTNYTGGFTLRNLTTGQPLHNLAPIGTLGSGTGGNASQFNWLFTAPDPSLPEGHGVILYQYCPANGLAAYRVYNTLAGAPALPDAAAASLSATCTPGCIAVHGAPQGTRLTLHNLQGTTLLSTTDTRIPTVGLQPGLYLITAPALGQSVKALVRAGSK